jgi:hypothetical protein
MILYAESKISRTNYFSSITRDIVTAVMLYALASKADDGADLTVNRCAMLTV